MPKYSRFDQEPTFTRSFAGLFKSRKSLLSMAAILVTLAMAATGQIEADLAIKLIAGNIGILVGAIAFEDGKEKGATHVEQEMTQEG